MKNICLACKGRLWCGKRSCIILEKVRLKARIRPIKSTEIFGSSPPAVFIGRFNYPLINTGILLPQETGNTAMLDSPKDWYRENLQIDKILDMRTSLINSRKVSPVRIATHPDRFLETLQEVAMTSSPIDTEVRLKKIPVLRMNFDGSAPPFGPSGLVERAEITSNPKVERRVDYICSDTDFKAKDAIIDLYEHGQDVYQISRILSVGLLGLRIQRRLVPTRWSITAADSIVADYLLESVKTYPQISEFMLFEANYMGNYFEVLLMPSAWTFEQVEIAVPGGMWSQKMKEPTIISDYESYRGRKTYAKDVAGAYYSAKLAVLEYLDKVKRQAGVLIVREIRPEYWSEVGVWKIRECVRDAMTKKPLTFPDLNSAIQRIDQVLISKHTIWERNSKIIGNLKYQKKIHHFLNLPFEKSVSKKSLKFRSSFNINSRIKNNIFSTSHQNLYLVDDYPTAYSHL